MGPHAHISYEKIPVLKDVLNLYRINLEVYLTSKILDTISPSEIIFLEKWLDYSPEITIHGPFMDLSPGAVDSKVREVTIERFKTVLDIAEGLSAKAVIFHSGYEKWRYGLNMNIWLEQSLKTWREISDYSNRDIIICIENIFEDEPSNLKSLMEELDNSRFGLCFDTGHFNLFSKVSLEEWLKETIPYIKELHLHNNDKTSDQHAPLNKGTFDMVALLDTIGERPCIYTIEAHNPEDFFESLRWFDEFKAGRFRFSV